MQAPKLRKVYHIYGNHKWTSSFGSFIIISIIVVQAEVPVGQIILVYSLYRYTIINYIN